MTFMVFMYAAGGYAVVFLAATLLLEQRGPVTQQARFSHAANRPPLRPWSRPGRGCPVGHERTLPLRSAQQRSTPARRKRPAPTSCRR